jgi:hypothetical protein
LEDAVAEPVSVNKQIKVGLGDALQRLLAVEMRLMNGFTHIEEQDLAQRQLILDSLNLTQLDLGFDCDNDGVPDNMDIFEQAAATSCCRVLPAEDKPKKAKGKSRVKVEPEPAPVPEPEPTPVVQAEAPPVTTEPEAPKKPTKKSRGFLSTLFGGE